MAEQLGGSEVEEADLSLVMARIRYFIDQRIFGMKLGLSDFLASATMHRVLKFEE